MPHLSEQFVESLRDSIETMRNYADGVTREKEYLEDTSVGRVLRERVEALYVRADILDGWLKRRLKESETN